MKNERIKKDRTEFSVCTYLGEMKFDKVDQFVYLGALISNKCEEVREIDTRLGKANRIVGIMNNLLRAKKLLRTTKFRLYKTVIRPTALYECETWVLNQATREMLRRWEESYFEGY